MADDQKPAWTAPPDIALGALYQRPDGTTYLRADGPLADGPQRAVVNAWAAWLKVNGWVFDWNALIPPPPYVLKVLAALYAEEWGVDPREAAEIIKEEMP